jgi:hypothetical protein
LALFDDAEMRDARISRMVLHEIGPNEADFKLLNGTVDPGELQEFFLERLSDANKGSSYTFKADSTLLPLLREVAAHPADLEDVGKRIATSFNERHLGNVKAGTLAIFELSSPTRSQYAIVKFDSQRVVSLDETADAHARLRLFRKTIVESKEAMQKSALIRFTDTGGELAVRDRRTSTRIPAYFVDFLGVERVLSEKDLTKRLAEALRATAAEHRELLGNRAVVEFPTRMYEAVQNSEVFDSENDAMLTAVLGALSEDSPVRETFARKLAEKDMAHEQFTLVKEAVPQPTKRRLTTVEGIQLTYGAIYEDNVRSVEDRVTGITTITITTRGIEKNEQFS